MEGNKKRNQKKQEIEVSHASSATPNCKEKSK